MFVRGKVHKKLKEENISLEREYSKYLRKYRAGVEDYLRLTMKYQQLLATHDNLKRQVESSPFKKEDLARLIRLCHPDKHGGKDVANRMTQMLLKMRGADK